MAIARALIIDDEEDIRELLAITLNRMDISTEVAADIRSAKKLLTLYHFDVCLTDMRLPDGDGLVLLKKLQDTQPELPVIVITAHGNTSLAVKAMKQGAFDFLSKPIDLKGLRQIVTHSLKVNQPQPSKPSELKLLGDSAVMQGIRTKIKKIACSQVPVYIKGESGVGKELVARSIHDQSSREGDFIAVNCGAIPAELMESEFFGHKKGSFTGAHDDKVGLFQAAEGGTLFLDELADLPLLLQVKLLRALQEKKIRPIGYAQEINIDIRLLSATHKDLNQLVQQGEFRQDLYYRVNVIELEVPPLRQRREDISPLCDYFLTEIAANNQIEPVPLSDEALNVLMHYPFLGNVRELVNILERAVALYEGEHITPEDLNLPTEIDSRLDVKTYQSATRSLEDYLNAIEKKVISQALNDNQGNEVTTAEQLGLSNRSLAYRLKKLGL